MSNRRAISIALFAILVITLLVFLTSQFVQPILPPEINSAVVLLFVALVGTIAVLAGLNDIIELVERLFGNQTETKRSTLKDSTLPISQVSEQPTTSERFSDDSAELHSLGAEIATSEKDLEQLTIDDNALQSTLAQARRVLAILEKQAAGYTSLTVPAHLKIELEEKRKEVAELEARLAKDGAPAPDAQVEFSYKIVSKGPTYRLGIIVSNKGFHKIEHFKLEFTFPNFDLINGAGRPVGTVKINPSDSSVVKIRKEKQEYRVTLESSRLFLDEERDLGEDLNLDYWIDKDQGVLPGSIYRGIVTTLSVEWTLYASGMQTKRGQILFLDLVQHGLYS